MNIDFEKIPVEIFDWIEKLSFDQLSPIQKEKVLSYFSREEYLEMNQTALSLNSVANIENSSSSEQNKKVLLTHFDKHQASKNERNNKRLFAWQAAAIVLMMLSGWLFYQVFGMERNFSVKQVAATDTVYVTKEIHSEPEIVHDTIYRYKATSQKQESSYVKEGFNTSTESNSIEGLEPLPTMERENLNCSQKGNSMKDDSLLRKFGFVAM